MFVEQDAGGVDLDVGLKKLRRVGQRGDLGDRASRITSGKASTLIRAFIFGASVSTLRLGDLDVDLHRAVEIGMRAMICRSRTVAPSSICGSCGPTCAAGSLA